jgi:hypothetical protein
MTAGWSMDFSTARLPAELGERPRTDERPGGRADERPSGRVTLRYSAYRGQGTRTDHGRRTRRIRPSVRRCPPDNQFRPPHSPDTRSIAAPDRRTRSIAAHDRQPGPGCVGYRLLGRFTCLDGKFWESGKQALVDCARRIQRYLRLMGNKWETSKSK